MLTKETEEEETLADDFEFDLEGFERDLDVTLENSRKAFTGKYKDELNALSGLSTEEIDAITIDGQRP